MKVIVVGAGVMGLATAWALDRLGHEVAVFEQAKVPNPLGSSVDQHRLIRYPYGAHSGYMRMVADAYAVWEQVWADFGERLHVPTGTLALAGATTDWLDQSGRALESAGHEIEWLSRRDLVERFPLIDAAEVTEAFFLPTGGVLLAERIVAGFARCLMGRDVPIWQNTPVHAVDPEQGRITLEDGRRIEADAVVVAAGPWTPHLLPGWEERLKPSRQVAIYLMPPDDLAAAWSAGPMLLDIDGGSGFYAVPPVAGCGLKVSDHRFSLTGDPDRDRGATAADAATILESCRHRLRRFDEYRVSHMKTCFYTVEPSERFVVEPVGARGWVMSACSGHGFKFAALLGSALAGAISTGAAGDLPQWAAGGAE